MPGARVLALVVMVLGVWASPAPGQAVTGPTLDPDAPPPACRASRTVACGHVSTPGASGKALAKALERRGLGVLTPRALAGRKKAAKLEKALKKGWARAAQFSTSQAGATVVRGARGSNAYEWRFQYDIPDPCPDPGLPDSTGGKARMTGIGQLQLVSIERRGRYTIRTDVIARLQTDARLVVSRRAELVFLASREGTPDVMTVRRTQTVTDRHTGHSTERRAGADVQVQTYAPDVKTAVRAAAFDRVVAQEDAEPGRDADGPVLTSEFNRALQALAVHIGDLMWKAAKQAEAHWRTPGTCFTLTLAGPSNVAPGGTAAITAKVSSPRGYSARQILGTGGGSATWTEGTVVRGLEAHSLVERLPLPESDPWVEWTAPDEPWTDDARPGFSLTLPTKAGVASAQILFPPPAAPYYVIDAVTYDANHDASSSGSSIPCSANGNTVDKVQTGPLPFDPETNKLTFSGGAYRGSIAASPDQLSASRTGVYHGCDLTHIPPPPCDTIIDQRVPMPIELSVDIPKGSETATVSWFLPAVTVGDGGPGSPCYTPTLTATPATPDGAEPASAFLDPGPHTLTVTRPTSFVLDVPGLHQQISGQTIATITFRRVNADGSPYTG